MLAEPVVCADWVFVGCFAEDWFGGLLWLLRLLGFGIEGLLGAIDCSIDLGEVGVFVGGVEVGAEFFVFDVVGDLSFL